MINDILAGVKPPDGLRTLLNNIAELIRQNRDVPLRLYALSDQIRASEAAVRAALEAVPIPESEREPAVVARRLARDVTKKE